MSDVAVSPKERLPEAFPAQGGAAGFDQNWYPVALSREVGRGQVIGRDVMDGRVAIFRTESGEASVLGAYCSHFGADLSKGKVVGERLQCPFHHWQYGTQGACENLPSGDRIPTGARQFRFPTLERMGVIWIFNGEEPLYDFPMLDASEEDYDLVSYRLRDLGTDIQTFMCNTLDFQHFRVVHGLRLENNQDPEAQFEPHCVSFAIRMSPPEGYALDYRLAIHGTNWFALRGTANGREVKGAMAGCPLPGNRCRMFIFTATPKGDGSAEAQRQIETFLTTVSRLRDKIITEDWPILNSIGHPRNTLLTKSDRHLGRFLVYLRRFPRAHPAWRSMATFRPR